MEEFIRHLVEGKKRDLHVHTKYCNHASGEMVDYVESALERGLEEIGFLAHAEVGLAGKPKKWLDRTDLEVYWREGNELKERYRGRIVVSLGLELGLNTRRPDLVGEVIGLHPWDRIGLSHHFVPHGGDLVNIASRRETEGWQGIDPLELYLAYYQGLKEYLAEIRPFMVCHFDVPRKFLTDLGPHPSLLEPARLILEQMAILGTKLEVNTSGYRQTGRLYPAPWILRQAAALGIRPVLCSDSHRPEDPGRNFERAVRDIEELGRRVDPGAEGWAAR
ncbi:MAG: histidinol-phosphatase [Pseudomonadota bacterium]